MMLHTITSQLGLIALALACGVALLKGGQGERIGAVMVAVTWTGLLLVQHLTGEAVPQIPLLISDMLLGAGFLALAIRYSTIWPGLGMLFQSAAFGLHLLHMTDGMHGARAYVLGVNTVSYCVLLCLMGGAIATWVKRDRASRRPRVLLTACG